MPHLAWVIPRAGTPALPEEGSSVISVALAAVQVLASGSYVGGNGSAGGAGIVYVIEYF
jgi:hypothetical protein